MDGGLLMWHKTAAGMLAGLLAMVLVPSTLCLWFVSAINLILAASLVLALTLWAVVLTWCYAATDAAIAWRRAAWVSCPLIIVYGLTFFIAKLPAAGALG